jgi:hypothetical protein
MLGKNNNMIHIELFEMVVFDEEVFLAILIYLTFLIHFSIKVNDLVGEEQERNKHHLDEKI